MDTPAASRVCSFSKAGPPALSFTPPLTSTIRHRSEPSSDREPRKLTMSRAPRSSSPRPRVSVGMKTSTLPETEPREEQAAGAEEGAEEEAAASSRTALKRQTASPSRRESTVQPRPDKNTLTFSTAAGLSTSTSRTAPFTVANQSRQRITGSGQGSPRQSSTFMNKLLPVGWRKKDGRARERPKPGVQPVKRPKKAARDTGTLE